VAKARIDQLLVDRGQADSRAKAQALVIAGTVYVRGQRVDKPGTSVPDDTEIEVRDGKLPYVSRGGVKLAGALDAFAIDPRGLRCLDVGASTGGFTDCLLQRGAAHVVAVDVGYGQLAQKLRVDPRVTNLERTNARTLTPEAIGGEAELTVVDASFIGLAKLAEALARCTRDGGTLVALVKPQFEVGRAEASRGKGVVRDEAVRASAIADARAAIEAVGFAVRGEVDCVIAGPKGNLEAFFHAVRVSASLTTDRMRVRESDPTVG
jgi:23S rRNA (cytidine1920-2'-O)/16S rRNA (cytidine1409-2'-O)-methyltransferase